MMTLQCITLVCVRTRLEGHQDTVEDVVFCPGSATEVVSVGDDKLMLFWDTRQGTKPVRRVDGAHPKQDIHCVDWSALQQHLIATGELANAASFSCWEHEPLPATVMPAPACIPKCVHHMDRSCACIRDVCIPPAACIPQAALVLARLPARAVI